MTKTANNNSQILAQAWLLPSGKWGTFKHAQEELSLVFEQAGGEFVPHPDDDEYEGIFHVSISQETFDLLKARSDIIDTIPHDTKLALFNLDQGEIVTLTETDEEIRVGGSGDSVEEEEEERARNRYPGLALAA